MGAGASSVVPIPGTDLTATDVGAGLVKAADFGNCGLTVLQLEELGMMLRAPTCILSKLFLAGNALGSGEAAVIANAVKHSLTLDKVDLSNNRIGDRGTLALARAFRQSPGLETLMLGDNCISTRGGKWLAKRVNPITQWYLPPSLRFRRNRFPVLKVLHLDGNDILFPAWLRLARAIRRNPVLMQLNCSGTVLDLHALRGKTPTPEITLARCGLRDGDAAVIAALMNLNMATQALDLSGNAIGTEGAREIGVALGANLKLLALDLSHNAGVGDLAGQEFATALGAGANRTLERLYLGGCSFTTAMGRAMAPALAANGVLKTLSLSHETFQVDDWRGNGAAELSLRHRRISDLDVCALGGLVAGNCTLTSLDLGQNTVGADGATALAKALCSNTTLRRLDLCQNRVGHDGASLLGKALWQNTTLQELRLASNNVDDGAAVDLGEGLKENGSVQVLDLSHNAVQHAGFKEICEALMTNHALSDLDLSHNGLSVTKEDGKAHKATVRAMELGIKANTALTRLRLHGNKLGAVGAEAISGGLTMNMTLAALSLHSNELGEEGADALAANFEENNTLTSLSLSNNKFGHLHKRKLMSKFRGGKEHLDVGLGYDQPETAFGGTISDNYRALKRKADELAQLQAQNGGKPLTAAAKKALKAKLAAESSGEIKPLKFDMLSGRSSQFIVADSMGAQFKANPFPEDGVTPQ